VEKDPLEGQVREALPGANCGACGFPGCDGYASAVAAKTADISRCSVGGKDTAEKLSAVMGVSATVIPAVAVLACKGSKEHAPLKGNYTGVATCRGAKLSAGGTKLCAWGCLGYGDCTKVCKFGALSMGSEGLPVIDYAKCTGCKICIAECPQTILKAVSRETLGAIVICSNHNPIKAMVMKTCKAGCIKCELCVKNCPKQCITMINGIPQVDYATCTSCGACVSKCPTKVFKILQKDVFVS
jgi:Na+-translocating ferredoxin:NAD+ oxidoreductase RNF subunit RnfB